MVEGVKILDGSRHQDERGFFEEWYGKNTLENFEVMQANLSRSNLGVIRGLHFSFEENNQAKLVKCIEGEIWDVVVDFRRHSPSYLKWTAMKLSSEKNTAIYIPPGVGHGFQSLTPSSSIVYLQTSVYDPEKEFTINPLDSTLAISWPISFRESTISERDASAPSISWLS